MSVSAHAPNHQIDPTYAATSGPLRSRGTDGNAMLTGDVNGCHISDEMLATMHAEDNPAFWDYKMTPGFAWPDIYNGTPYAPSITVVRLVPLPT